MINFKNLSYTYLGQETECIKSNSLIAKDGEVVVITGESGCGKSTVLRCINGLGTEFYEGILDGEIIADGHDCLGMHICDISKIVSTVFQNPDNQFFTLDVLSDLVFGCENFSVSREEITERLERIIDLLDIRIFIGRRFSELSGGEKQKIAIASALMLNSKNLLMDEPSASLDYHSIELLGTLVLKLKHAGYTVIIAEHRLYYLKDIIDKLVIMKDGTIKEKYYKDEITRLDDSTLHELGIRGINIFENPYSNLYFKTRSNPMEIATLSNVSFYYKSDKKVLKSIDLQIYQGDRIAIIGKNGSGKTTLAKLISGLCKEKSGVILFNGKRESAKKRSEKVSYVMQNVDFQIFGSSVYNDLLLGNETRDEIDSKIHTILNSLNLSDSINDHPMTLSIGQKQRLIVASSCILNKQLSIFDEPTSGLDYKNMKSVCEAIKFYVGENNASIIITHDYEFILNSCNRVILLEDGYITEDFRLYDCKKLRKIFLERL